MALNMKNKSRIELIDTVKAITIILVILGHTTGKMDTPMYMRIIYAFHMPLFFLLSGMSIKPTALSTFEDWKKYLRKNILALVVPYLIFAFIYAPFSFENIPRFLYGSWQMLAEAGTLTSLWYLTAFFVARIYSQILINVVDGTRFENKDNILGIISIPMFAVGFLLPKIQIGYPWCLDVSFVASGFILLGISLRKRILVFAQSKAWIILVFTVISAVLFSCGTIMRGDALELSLMCKGEYGNLFWFMINSFSGSAFVFGIVMLFLRLSREGARPFSIAAIKYVGRHTLGIFLLHKNVQLELVIPWLNSFISGPQLLTACIATCISFAIALLLCTIIERYVPQMLGQFPVYPENDDR